MFNFFQPNSSFWKRKTSDKPDRAPRAKSKATKKAAKKKTGEAADPPEDAEDSDQEVKLDSLGSFFIHLINNDYHQDDVEVSRADHVEVISVPPIQISCRFKDFAVQFGK